MSSTIVPTVRLVATYQRMGDGPGAPWMVEVLRDAVINDKIADFKVLGSYPGVYGLELVVFTVDVTLGTQGMHEGHTYDQAKEAGENLLNGPIVPDSDVEVLWVSPVERTIANGYWVGFGGPFDTHEEAMAYATAAQYPLEYIEKVD